MTTLRHGDWTDEHEEEATTPAGDSAMIWEPPRTPRTAPFVPRIAIVGPGDDMTNTLAVALLARAASAGAPPLVIVIDADGWEAATHLRAAFAATIDAARIVSVTPRSPNSSDGLLSAIANDVIARFPDAGCVCYIAYAASATDVLDAMLVHYTVGVLAATTPLQPASALVRTTDCLIVHAPNSARHAIDTAIAPIIAARGHLPTAVIDLLQADGLDALAAFIWEELSGGGESHNG